MQFLSEYLRAWSRHRIHFGVSCTPGKLAEHAGVFPTALTTHNIFIPNPEIPPVNMLTMQIEDHCLIFRFPFARHFKQLRGSFNERFLDPVSLLRVMDGVSERHTILLSIPRVSPREALSFNQFLDKLHTFFAALPTTRRYALELDNPNYLLPDYFACLQKHKVAHFIQEKVVFTAEFGIARGGEIVYAVRHAIEEVKTLYVYVEEVRQLDYLMEVLNNDLKRLSPIRMKQSAA